MNGEMCTHCGAAPVEPGTGLCDPCFEAMPLGVWVSAWDMERGPGMTGETCAVCGETVPVSVLQWGGATPYCPECFGTETGTVCGCRAIPPDTVSKVQACYDPLGPVPFPKDAGV